MKIQMVISRYKESLDWIDDFQVATLIYNKGEIFNVNNSKNITIINLPNIGREGHTYLHHIIANYDNLADITVFFPGSLNKTPNKYGNTYKYNKACNVMKYSLQGKSVIMGVNIPNLPKRFYNFTINEWVCTDPSNVIGSNSALEPSSIRPFGRWYTHFFGNTPCNYFVTGGVFSMHKDNILQKPLIYYIKLILELQTHNPEAGHYLERSWEAVFSPLVNTLFIPYNY